MSVSFVSFRIARILSRESACRIRSSCTYREPTDRAELLKHAAAEPEPNNCRVSNPGTHTGRTESKASSAEKHEA